MRTIDECRAEVFRRMENGIKERRRKRNRIIAVCAPLCLCLVMYSAMILPAMLPASESDDGAENEMVADRTEGDPQILFTSVEIVNSSYPTEKHTVSTDAGEVDMLYTDIQGLFDKSVFEDCDGAVVPEIEEVPDATDNSSISSNIAHPKYTITFCSSYGDRIVYEINGNRLIYCTTDDETVLTEAELMELLSRLTVLFDGKENAE